MTRLLGRLQRRHWPARCSQADPQPAGADRHAGAFCVFHNPARLGPYRRRATVGGDGRQSRRRWPQPDGVCRCANPAGPGLPRGAPHRRQRPDIGQLQHPLLVERRFSDEIPGLLQHADLAISRPEPAASVSWRPADSAVLVPFPQAADQHQEANAACAASLVPP